MQKQWSTPVKKIENIYFKCEFLNPSGSVKDRGISHQIERLKAKGAKSAVISSSGNAAISAAFYCKQEGVKLKVFVSPKINPAKLKILDDSGFNVEKTLRPISGAIKYSKENQAVNLRQSTDPEAILGFESIAYELEEQVSKIDALFLPISSGTTLVGIASGFKNLGFSPSFHIVQTEVIHPLAAFFDHDFKEKKGSLADAIVAKYTLREKEVLEIVRGSGGAGWVISDQEMIKARKWLNSFDLNCSYEGAATLAAVWKAERKGYKYHRPVCLLTGKDYSR